MNAVAPRAAAALAVASLQDLKAGLQNVQQTIVARGGDPFMRLLTDGTWVYGAENVEVEQGSIWALNPLSIKHGYVSWTDHPGKQANEIVGEIMVPLTSPLPAENALRDTGWPWTQQLSVVAVCLSGEDTGTQVLYKTSSVGGATAMKELIGKITAQLDRDPVNIVPVIVWDQSSYPHKKYGKTYTPVLSIQKWVPLTDDLPDELEDEQQAAGAAPAETPAPQPEPTKPARATRRSTPAVKPQAEKQAEAGLVDADAARAAEMEALRAEIERLKGGNAGTAMQDAAQTAAAEQPAPGQTLRRRTRG